MDDAMRGLLSSLGEDRTKQLLGLHAGGYLEPLLDMHQDGKVKPLVEMRERKPTALESILAGGKPDVECESNATQTSVNASENIALKLNLISLNRQLHWWFANGRMALKPLRKTDNGAVVVQFHWLKRSGLPGSPQLFSNDEVDIDALFEAAGLEDNTAWGETLCGRNGGFLIETGQTFTLQARDPSHTPNFELLQLSWELLRIVAISGIVELAGSLQKEAGSRGKDGAESCSSCDGGPFDKIQRWVDKLSRLYLLGVDLELWLVLVDKFTNKHYAAGESFSPPRSLAAGLAVPAAHALPGQHDDEKNFVISQEPALTLQYKPQAMSAAVLANVTDPDLSRDSCGSVKMGPRTLWACRDTAVRIPGTDRYGFLFANTAGWTGHGRDGAPAIQTGGPAGAGSDGANEILLMTGPRPTLPTFYPLGPNMCPNSGVCDDGTTRWTGWPDSPPLVTETARDGTVTAYTWVRNSHIASGSLEVLTPQPSTTLYKMAYKPDANPNVLPAVTTVDAGFWAEHQIAYGAYGSVAGGGYAYLYGLLSPGGVALARVPVGKVEDKSQYEYYAHGGWTSTMPAIDDPAAAIANAGTTGQGTFYYSSRARSYVWIGQGSPSIWADFYITTAPSPEGPWISPYLLYSGPNGDGDLPSYSLQAHPHMLREYDDGIYLTWTQYFKPSTYAAYVTPLAYVSFV
ncbi:hypothetical protein Trco_002280 [Trichoderma cornu-damae]|uniref:DUF4185 domain-containing protein n=1 Tax=Trichoderma cornu-damae TaxID=654480 RepID=A0A9P8TYZ4_9HYPO|nr:hypothetical protein Trco_002280 [Trichoderma cornu-damae]